MRTGRGDVVVVRWGGARETEQEIGVFLLLTPHLCNTTCEASYARDKVMQSPKWKESTLLSALPIHVT